MLNIRNLVSIMMIAAVMLSAGIVAVTPQPAMAAGANWYVATTGNDTTGNGVSLPWRTIKHAISMAAAGDTVNVAIGEYVEDGQIAISKNLNIVGADKATTVIKPNADTAATGDLGGWWLVNPGIVFNLSGVTLDGTGYKISRGIRHKGTGTIQNVHFTNLQYEASGPTYGGFAIYAFGMCGAVDVSDCVFDNIGREGIAYWGAGTTGTYARNTYTGKGLGNWLDYGVEVSTAAVVTITDSTITNNLGTATSDGSNSAGIIVLQDGSTATVTGNTITGNDIAIKVGYNSPVSSATAYAHGNTFSNNASGCLHGTAGGAFDATNNWWGSANGPTHVKNVFNVVSQGDKVGDYITYVPWLGTEGGTAFDGPISNSTNYYSNFADAIAGATAGDTLNAAEGTYTENINVDRSLTIHGAGSATTVIDGGGSGTVVNIAASNVNLSGFTVQGSGSAGTDAGIFIQAVNSCIVTTNKITGNANGIGMYMGSGNAITSNEIDNNAVYGVALAGSSNNTIESNTITNIGLAAKFDAIALDNASAFGGSATDGSTGNHIKTNTISNIGRDGIFIGDNCEANYITDGNNLSNITKNAIHIWRPGTQTITDNVISGAAIGIRLKGSSNNTITGNAITGNGEGIHAEASWQEGVWYPCANNNISLNNISGNTNGISVPEADAHGTMVAATNNWWGIINGPAHAKNVFNVDHQGNPVSNNVTYVPWLGTEGGTTFAGPISNSTAYYSNFTDAIAAANASDTINAVAGTYTENVNVGIPLTLQGAITGEETDGADGHTVTVNAANPAVSVFNVTANSVNISGFTVSGATGGGQAGIFLGAGVTGCNISNNNLTGNYDGIWLGSGSNHNTLANNTLSSNYQGFEVYISSDNTFTNNNAYSNNNYGFKIDSGAHNTYTNNTANSNTKYGFYVVIGDGGGATNTTFTNNTANLNTQYGMRINGGTGYILTGNTFNSNVLEGVRLKEPITNLELHNNNITNNPVGINIDVSVTDVATWAVSNNNITGSTISGIANNGTGTLNAVHNWWGNASGPSHTDATLGVVTYGDKVTGNVSFQPWLIAPYTGQAIGTALSITTSDPLPEGRTSEAYSAPLAADGGTTTRNWAYYDGADSVHVPGLTPGANDLAGTPTHTGNPFMLGLQVNDGVQATYLPFHLTIYASGLGIITNSPLPDGEVDLPYSTTLEATGGTGGYAWSKYSGSLPSAFILGRGTGIISGTPGALDSGTFNFRAKVVSNSQASFKDLSMLVYPALEVATKTLPDATVGSAYNQTLQTTGGKSPVTWQITTGQPEWLNLNSATGILSGTPTAAGTADFTVRAMDNLNVQSDQPLTLSINNIAAPSVTTSGHRELADTSVRLLGDLTDLGSTPSAKVSFMYGTTDACADGTSSIKTFNTPKYFGIKLSGLTPGTKYYYKAQAVGNGTGYGTVLSFTTTGGTTPPTITTSGHRELADTSVRLLGDLTDLGSAPSAKVSFMYGTTEACADGTSSIKTFNTPKYFGIKLSGLTPGTKYYYKAQAVGNGTGYGAVLSFTTLGGTPPTITTSGHRELADTSVRLLGDLTDLGSAPSAKVSFMYGTTEACADGISSIKTFNTPKYFGIKLSGLAPNTKYYYKAQAVGNGTGYGAVLNFTTTP